MAFPISAAKNWSEGLNFRSTNLANEKLYADAPAVNQLYGGKMNQYRRNAIGAITQVPILLEETPVTIYETSNSALKLPFWKLLSPNWRTVCMGTK